MKYAFICSVLAIGTLTASLVTTANAADSVLPPLSPNSQQLSTLPEVLVTRFEFNGNRQFSDAVLRALLTDYEGRKISAEELQDIRNLLTQHYINNGFINSGAIIPDQEVVDGIIQLKIIEGKLSEIQVKGNNKLRTPYIDGRLSGKKEEILNTDKLQERLQILQQNPLIKRFNAELGPGLKPGEAILNIEITEQRPWQLELGINNHRAPSIGSNRAELRLRHRNLTGWGDTLYARLGLTEGLRDYTLNYSIPINRYDTTLTVHAEQSNSDVITESFEQLRINSEAETYYISLRHPFYKAYSKDFNYCVFDMGLSLDLRRSQTYLLDQPYSFSPGVQDGESKLSMLRFSQNWLDRSRDRVIALSSVFTFGLNAFDATINDGLNDQQESTIEPDSRFITWLGQFRWIERLPKLWNSQLWLRADAQYSNDDLLPLEKFALGGHATVRGYRENYMTRDRGFIASVEWQVPLMQLPIPKLSKEGEGALLLAAFFDFGSGNNTNLSTPDPRHIYSAGLGLLWSPSQHVQAELYWGHALQDIPAQEDHDLQDDGIHFALTFQY